MLHRLVLTAAAAAALLVFSAGAGAAASANVSCSAGGAGLVSAVNAANTAGGGSINLESGCTYSLTTANNNTFGNTGLPVVTTTVTINGKGATIAGNNSGFRILAIDGSSGGALILNGVTITGGKASGPMLAGAGGGILDAGGTLTLNSALVTQNSASSAGGGIAAGNGTVTLNKSEVSWNSVPGASGSGGGGILSMASTLTVNNSTIDHNSGPGGGGIASGNGQGGGAPSSITLNHSVVSFNTASGNPMSGGGGISNGGTLESNNSEIVNNSAPGETGGGLLNHVTATLNHTTVSGNTAEGGLGGGIVNAIFFDGQPTPTLVLNNSDVTGNSADVGGGIVNTTFADTAPAGTVTLNHTDVTGNTPNNCVPVGSIAGCSDTVIVFTAALNGGNQNPPLAVAGTGMTKVTWNTLTNQMTVDISFSGLTTGTTAAHIHCCVNPPGNTGVATTTPTFPGFPLGVTSGTYSRTFDMTAASSYNSAFVTAHGGTTAGAAAALLSGLEAGQAYLNIHTTMFPGGEIRGFLRQP
jgi:CHRD domain